jgi:hypothetical protein
MSLSAQQFNSTTLDFAEQLSLVCPNSVISNNLHNVRLIINNHPNKIIELFIIYVLPDKDKIDSGDKSYFENKSYDNQLNNNNFAIQKFFEFKDIWYKLSEENKNLVVQYMQCLCYYAQEYFLEKYPA